MTSIKKLVKPFFICAGVLYVLVIAVSAIVLPLLEESIESGYIGAGVGIATSLSIGLSEYLPTNTESEIVFGILKVVGGFAHGFLVTAFIFLLQKEDKKIPSARRLFGKDDN